MKKHGFLRLLAIGLLFSLGSHASADCQEIRFSNGEKFCFDIEKISTERFRTRISNSSLGTFSDLSCKLTLPNSTQISLSRCEGEFTYRGTYGKIELRADIQNYWYELFANYDFANGKFSNGTSDTTPISNYTPEWTSVSDSSPDRNEWVDMTLRVKSLYSSNYYHGSVDFFVEEYRNGRWISASSSDYDLERTSYHFSSSDQGEIRFRNLIKFRNEGDFRIVAELRNYGNKKAIQEFEVEDDYRDAYNNADSFSIHSVNPSSPAVDQRIDFIVRVVDRYGNLVRDYDERVRFEIEEYRNGSWRTASSSDYTLEQRTAYFDRYDNGEKTFSDFVKFRTTGEFRIKVLDDDQSSLYGTREVTIRNYGSNDYYPNNTHFTEKELKKIKAVAEIWREVITALEKDYPRLRQSTYRKRLSDDFYSNMQGVLRNGSSSFRKRSDFYSAFQERLSFTVRTR